MPDFDLLTYSFPCFVADTLVLTSRGYIPIQEVREEDVVITHLNRRKKVLCTMDKDFKGDLYHVKALGVHDITCTPEHPFYIRQMKRRKGKREFSEPIWSSAKNLKKGDFVGIPINNESAMPKWDGTIDNRWGHHKKVNRLKDLFALPNFWYLMGRYIGDGWRISSKRGKGNKVYIACSDRNRDSLLDAIKSIGFNYSIDKTRTCDKVIICSNELHLFVERYGHGAKNKQIDGETLDLPKDLLKHFLNGVIDSDGCKIKDFYKISTISKRLAYGLSLCVHKVYNIACSVHFTKRPDTYVIEDRICHQNDTYDVCFKTHRAKQDKSYYSDGYIWLPIQKITKEKAETKVYNLSVEEDESYIVNGCIVHNCQDISASGLQKGFEEDSGTRSSLLWHIRKAVIAKRPKYLLMENVRALTFKKNMPLFTKWQDELVSYGYTNYWQVLNATDFNVPQNRQRVFMISILNDEEGFIFPKPIGLTKTIANVLEENVDECYYLNQSVVNKYLEVTADTRHNHNLGLRKRSDIAYTIRTKSGGASR